MDELITVVLSLFFGLASFYAIYSIFLYVYQSGIFWNIDVSMQTRHVLSSRKIIAYKVYRGDYAKIYQTFAPIMRLAPYSDTIGIYYDNSGTVARTRRRYAVGVVVERCGSRMSVEELVRLLESKGFKFFCLEGFVLEGRGNSNIRLTPMVKAVFPIKSRLGSTIATIRVYPKLRQFIQNQMYEYLGIILGACALIVIFVLTMYYVFAQSGMLVNIEVNMRTKHVFNTPRILGYKTYTGYYKHAHAAFASLAKVAPFSDTVAIYYDDPEMGDRRTFRYVAAAVVEPCGDKMTLDELVNRLEEAEYKFFALPGSDPDESALSDRKNVQKSRTNPRFAPMVNCEFPITNALSLLVAIRRVYPRLRAYIQDRMLSVQTFVEYYQRERSVMHFLVPCTNLYRFYVPEFSEDNEQYGADTYNELVERQNIRAMRGDVQTTSV